MYSHERTSGALLSSARRAADLSQVDLARRAGTTQPAIAAYETDSRTPSFKTLERLLNACDYDVDLDVRPRMRRGSASLSELASTIEEDLAGKSGQAESDATRLLFGFGDDFRGSSRPG